MSGVDSAVRILFGRDPELDLIDRLLDIARRAPVVDAGPARPATLLLIGEPGVGKSALLDAAAVAATAAGVLVLRTTGLESEAGIAYSALDRLLAPLLPDPARPFHPDWLIGAHRGAAVAPPGGGVGAPAGWFSVGDAALDLLRTTAAKRPLLLLIDDAQWLDTASAAVLAFVARRLARTRIAFIAAARSGSDGPLNPAVLPHRLLRPLDDASAALLVASSFPALSGRVHQRVLAEANGNPMALVDVPGALTESQRAECEPLPAVLPLTSRLRAQFKARFESLPARCRELLLLAALDGTGSIDLLLTAAGPDVVDGLAPAERARLILSERGGRLVFPHPLVAATVVTLSTEIERRHAHRALAAAYPDHGHHHAWHLAAGSVLPDESIAAMLDKSAHLTLRLGDAVGAITELTRAAELSPDRAHRGRRLAEAAYIDADVAGGLTHLPRLLGEDAVQDSGADRSLAAAIAQAYLRLNQDGDVLTAHRLLVAAIDGHRRRQSGPDTELVEALHALLFGSFFAGRDDLWAQFHVRLAEAGSAVPAALSIGASTFADPARASQAELASLDAMVADLRDETDPTVIVRCGMAAIYVDRLAGCRSALWRLVRDGRAGGAVTSAIDAMTLLCFDDLASGQWEHGQLLAAEALALCADNGYRLLEWPGLLATALLAAARGEGDLVTEVTARMRDWAAPRGVGIVQDYARQATALAAIGRGDFELAYRQASAISPPGRFAAHAPQALWVTLDLVESAVRTGRRDAALAHVAAMNATGIAAISSRLALTTAGCRAIAGADEDARVLYERALAVPGADRWPFEQARLQLCFGEFLRRQRDDAAARDQFAAALQTFQRLRATPWSARASRGARATGVPMRRPDGAAAVRLSPQQQQIATLAGSGLTNKEIAERMYLSHRTVGAHLYRLYPQLGVTSRAGLRDALAGIGSSTGADAGQAVR